MTTHDSNVFCFRKDAGDCTSVFHPEKQIRNSIIIRFLAVTRSGRHPVLILLGTYLWAELDSVSRFVANRIVKLYMYITLVSPWLARYTNERTINVSSSRYCTTKHTTKTLQPTHLSRDLHPMLYWKEVRLLLHNDPGRERVIFVIVRDSIR